MPARVHYPPPMVASAASEEAFALQEEVTFWPSEQNRWHPHPHPQYEDSGYYDYDSYQWRG